MERRIGRLKEKAAMACSVILSAMTGACLPDHLGEPCNRDQDCGGVLICRSLDSGKSCQIFENDEVELDQYEPGMLKESRDGHFLVEFTIDPPPQLGGTLWTLAILHRNDEGGLDPVRSVQFAIQQVKVGPEGEEVESAIDPLAIHLNEHFYQLGVIFDEPGLWQTTIEIDDGMHSDVVVIRVEVGV